MVIFSGRIYKFIPNHAFFLKNGLYIMILDNFTIYFMVIHEMWIVIVENPYIEPRTL